MFNLQTRSALFIDQKKSEIIQKSQIELSINSNTKKSIIQRLYSYNLLTDKLFGKVYQTIYKPDKKSEKGIEVLEMNFP